MTDTTDPAKKLLADILAIVNRHQGVNAQQAMDEIHEVLNSRIDCWLDSPEAVVGPQVFTCDQSPHPPAQCPRCEPIGGAS